MLNEEIIISILLKKDVVKLRRWLRDFMVKEAQSTPVDQVLKKDEHVDEGLPWEDTEPYMRIEGVSSRKIGWLLERSRRSPDAVWQQALEERLALAHTACCLWRKSMMESYEWKWGEECGGQEMVLTLEEITVEILLDSTRRERWKRWVECVSPEDHTNTPI